MNGVLLRTVERRGGIVGVYQRHDYLPEKREALLKWADEVVRAAEEGRAEWNARGKPCRTPVSDRTKRRTVSPSGSDELPESDG